MSLQFFCFQKYDSKVQRNFFQIHPETEIASQIQGFTIRLEIIYQESRKKNNRRFFKIAEFIMVYKCGSMSDLETQLKEAGDKLVVIDFFATWCGPCKMISPVLEEMEAQMSNVKFLKVDVDEAEDVAVHYQISAMPTFIFIKNGQKVNIFYSNL